MTQTCITTGSTEVCTWDTNPFDGFYWLGIVFMFLFVTGFVLTYFKRRL